MSTLVMLFAVVDVDPVVIYPTVAFIEFAGDVLPEFFINLEEVWPNRELLEERLGLMFMLVLGETMLGFLIQRYNVTLPGKTYSTLM